MQVTKSIKELQNELKSEKKRFDKIQKRMKRCTSSREYDELHDEAEALYDDMLQIHQLIEEEQLKKKRDQELQELMEGSN